MILKTILMCMLLLGNTAQKNVSFGTASYYAHKFEGRKTADGEIYRGNKFTAASNTLPFNTVVLVRNLKNDSTVIVRINDRMAKWNKRLIDLSRIAGRKLNFDGLTKVSVTIIDTCK